MKVTPLNIPDVKLIEPDVFEDERGFFYESFNQQKFNEAIGENINFVQDNHSKSIKGVLRGMHFQEAPFGQGKLVRVIAGEIYDVALDIRLNSSTYGQCVAKKLSAKNKRQLWIPQGFAHGFLTLSESAEVLYKTDNYYSKKHERVISFQDKRFDFSWPQTDQKIITSKKDSK